MSPFPACAKGGISRLLQDALPHARGRGGTRAGACRHWLTFVVDYATVRSAALHPVVVIGLATTPIACRTAPSDTALTSGHSAKTSDSSDAAAASVGAEGLDTGARPAAIAEPSRTSLPPLAGSSVLTKLPVVGFRDAVVFVPLGATTPRPLLIALHGNFDRPEWQCETWSEITGGHAFILCPRGIPRRDVPAKWDRWEYSSLDKTDRELEAGIGALREQFGQYVAPGPVLFTGFSLGAILGVGILKRHPGQYGPVVFSEGGNENWSIATVRKIAPPEADASADSGLRILYACGQADCVSKSKATAKIIERAGGQVRVVSGGNVGHMYDGPVAAAIKREWSWLIQGDARW